MLDKDPEQLALETIKDSKLRDFYSKIISEPYKTITNGQKLLKDKKIDKYAVLQAIQRSIEIIIEDIGEHGKANLESYGDHNLKYFKDLKKDIKSQISKSKEKTDVFKIYSETKEKARGDMIDAMILEDAEEHGTKIAEGVIEKK